jgi:hypothetical protein
MAQDETMGFESKNEPLLSLKAFQQRQMRSILAAGLLIGFSLFGGMLGYRLTEGMAWIDAFLNAAMILSGMGPQDTMKTWGGKLFAGLYALYSGLALIVVAGVIFGPIIHRQLHRFHLEDDTPEK